MADITLHIADIDEDIDVSRVRYNENFQICEETINDLQGLLNPSTEALSVADALIRAGANPITTNLLRCEASAQIVGNASVGEAFTAKSATITNNFTVSTGDITLSDTSKKLVNNGTTKLGGRVEMTNFGNSYIDAASESSFDSGNISGTNAVLTVSSVHAILLDYSSFDGDEYPLLTCSLPAPTVSQVLTLIVKVGLSAGTHALKATNIANMESTEVLRFDEDYCSLDLIAVGSSWVYRNLQGVTKV